MLAGHGRKTIFYQLACNQRGYYQIGPLVLETGDVFGLHRRYRLLTAPHFVLVYPEVDRPGRIRRRFAAAHRRGAASPIGCTKTPRGSPACGPTRRATR